MQTIKILIKKDLKRLLKSPLLLVVGIILPFCTTFLLNLTGISEPGEQDAMHDFRVYCVDASGSRKVDEVLERLQENQSISIQYEQCLALEETAYKAKAEEIIRDYSLQVVLIIPKQFEARLEAGEKAFYVYDAQYDERIGLFLKTLERMCAKESQLDDLQIYFVDLENEVSMKINKGYSFSVCMFIGAISLVFMIADLLVMNLWRSKEDDILYARMRIVGMTSWQYKCAQYFTLFIILALQCFSIGVCLLVGVKADLGLMPLKVIVLLYLLGVYVAIFGMLIESLCQKRNIANYIGVLSMFLQGVLASIFFPINQEHIWQEKLNFLFPQYWIVYTWQSIKQGETWSLLLYMAMIGMLGLFELMCIRQVEKIGRGSLQKEEEEQCTRKQSMFR